MITLRFVRDVLAIGAAISMLAGCASPQPPLSLPPNVSASVRHSVPATGGCCNIFWNKRRLDLPYPATAHAQAVLSYWASNGYFTYPVYCEKGSQISATAHRTWGNPKRYMHVVYWFEAKSPGPDRCSFTAVLSNTGSPPIAIIKLHIE